MLTLDHSGRGRGRHAEAYALHRDLLTFRRECALFRSSVDIATLDPGARVLRFTDPGGAVRLLSVNPALDLDVSQAERSLAPPSVSYIKV